MGTIDLVVRKDYCEAFGCDTPLNEGDEAVQFHNGRGQRVAVVHKDCAENYRKMAKISGETITREVLGTIHYKA